MCNIRKTAASGLFKPKIAYTSIIGIRRLPKLIIYIYWTVEATYTVLVLNLSTLRRQESIAFWAQLNIYTLNFERLGEAGRGEGCG